jgi:acetyltransferase-like isoleucine patch superfamily enzyme
MIKEIVSALCIILPSFLTCMIYRLVGHNIGKNAKISIFSYIHADEISIGNNVDIRPFVFIRVKKLSIGDNSIVSFGTQIKGVKTFFTKGNNFLGAHCLINCEEDVKLGFYSGLGPRCTVYTHGSFLPVIKGYPAKFEKVVLEDYVWIAMAVIILPGTYIESNCIINPGVVLKSRVKSNTLIEFNPVAFRGMDLNRLQKFVKKKSTSDYYKEIVSSFLVYYQMDYEYNEKDNCFSAGGKYVFTYFPESNMIELVYEKNKKIQYDLDNFAADYSRLKIHKKFLFFLRRRYGVILGINY